MTDPRFETQQDIDSLHYGVVRVETADGRVEASRLDQGAPRVELERTGDRTDKYSRLGSRDAAHLTCRIGDRAFTVDAGRPAFTKSSYEIAVALPDSTLQFVPVDLTTSEIRRTSSPDSMNNVLGRCSRLSDGTLLLLWSRPKTMLGQTVEPPQPTADEAVAIVAVAAGLGVGGLSIGTIVASAVGSIFS